MNDAIMIIYNVALRLLPSTSIYKMHEGVGGCEGPGKRWHGPMTVQSSGSRLKVVKQSSNNFFSGDVIPGRSGLLTN